MATEKQIAYINELIFQAKSRYRQIIREVERGHLEQFNARQAQHARVLLGLWEAVTVRESYTKQQASNWITLFTAPGRIVADCPRPEYAWLDRPAIAESFGVAAYVNEHRDAIAAAVRRV